MALREFSSVKVGDELPERIITLTRADLVNYAGVSGDLNPIHWDDEIAKQVGLDTAIAHGMLTMGLTGKMLTNYVGDGRLKKFGVRFTNQVWPGDTLETTATVEAIREENGQKLVDLTLSTKNQDGKEVVSGSATARID